MNKNILIVVNSLGLGGGAEKIAAKLGSNLKSRGYEVIFLARYDTKQKYGFEGKYRYLYEKRNKKTIRKAFRELKTPKIIAKICQEEEINTVISFSNLPNFCSILSKILFKNKARIIVSVRNNPLEYTTKTQKFLMKKLYPNADKVVVQTSRIKKMLYKRFSIKDLAVIPNMANLKKYKELAEKDIKEKHKDIFNDDFIFINVASLRNQKGQCKLIRCFKEVNNNIGNCKLIVLGNGPLKKKLENLTKRMNLEEKILFLGKVENVFPYLKKTDCFILSSFYEGFPNVVVEALSQNLPVISTDCLTGPREILCPRLKNEYDFTYPYYGKYGILTKPFDNKQIFKTLEEKPLSSEEEMFSKSMMNLIENKNLRKKFSNQFERVKDFEVDKIIKKWENIL